jgi:hypothetical protein
MTVGVLVGQPARHCLCCMASFVVCDKNATSSRCANSSPASLGTPCDKHATHRAVLSKGCGRHYCIAHQCHHSPYLPNEVHISAVAHQTQDVVLMCHLPLTYYNCGLLARTGPRLLPRGSSTLHPVSISGLATSTLEAHPRPTSIRHPVTLRPSGVSAASWRLPDGFPCRSSSHPSYSRG